MGGYHQHSQSRPCGSQGGSAKNFARYHKARQSTAHINILSPLFVDLPVQIQELHECGLHHLDTLRQTFKASIARYDYGGLPCKVLVVPRLKSPLCLCAEF
eukprot:356114-Chlamydomonas_euryale.AAC.10